MQTRVLTDADADRAFALGAEAFASAPPGARREPAEVPAWRTNVGVVDDDGAVVAKASGLRFSSWWHGAALPTLGVASVVVGAEHRGRGLLAGMLQALLEDGATHGEGVSMLYPTAAGIYRSLGWEVFASYDTVELPTAALARVRPPADVRTRRAGPEDLPAVRSTWTAWARHHDGPLTRDGAAFEETPDEMLAEQHGITLAVGPDGEAVGHAAWTRSRGYRGEGLLEVSDLVATSADGYRALWHLLGTFEPVAPRTRLRTSGDDPARLVLPTAAWDVIERQPCMLRVDDPAGVLAAVGPAVPGLAAEVPFAVRGDRLARADGDYRLVLRPDGPGTCERVEPSADAVVLSPQGLALAFAGVHSCATLRMLGHLAGPDAHDAVLDAVLGGRQAHVRDYF
ncbi:GNAT family N-acetyltransferase [Phycicoccus sp. BSK3Z-2]|uniref:GNAT family N-acetyltransferase n=1 Tax=Phycicoccus avicenniae TaxID=2828860 RepID=A0A941D6X8_9MICO|nr:GNAT family N-acetyltransferase [Phycicoccus avicenniae]MBR7743229.1 GNAT family N-acetyltransferase [Phycicoccus avicenniae]